MLYIYINVEQYNIICIMFLVKVLHFYIMRLNYDVFNTELYNTTVCDIFSVIL